MPDTLTPVARTPLHHWHLAHGARFVDRDGWQVVAAYSAAEPEAAAARAGLGLADVSDWVKISLRGPGVGVVGPARGRVAALDELSLACRLTDDHLLLLSSTAVMLPSIQRFVEQHAGTAVRTNVTSALAGFELIGPELEGVLCRLTHLDVRPAALPPDGCAETALAGVEALLVRPERGGLPALRLFVAWDLGEYVWERLLEAGAGVPLTPLGREALALLG